MTKMKEDGTWAGDLLNRHEDAAFLEPFLVNRIDDRGLAGQSRSFVLNIDAAWGEGKSFFLERFAKQLRKKNYLVAEVNAWHDDHADDPLLAVISAIDDAVAPALKKKTAVKHSWRTVKHSGAKIAVAAMKGAAIHWARKGLGEGVDAIVDGFADEPMASETVEIITASQDAAFEQFDEMLTVQAEHILEKFREEKKTIESFRSELSNFLSKLQSNAFQTPLFVLVDELDRCRPPYAIKLLERVKHLFEIDNVIFVIATDTDQLQHSIKAVYGSGFDSPRYLRRFFDRTYVFPKPAFDAFVRSLLRRFPLPEEKVSLPFGEDLEEFLVSAFSHFDLGPRDVEQAYDLLRTVVTSLQPQLRMELVVLLPMVIGHQIGIEPAFTRDFASAMNSIHGLELGGSDRWLVKLASARRGGMESPPREIAYLDLFRQATNLCTVPLSNFLNQTSDDDPAFDWAWRVASNELQVLHNNSYAPRNPPHSIMCQYPSLIAMAGRLRLPDSN
ncbi:MAG: hypothetical protein CVT73_00015 [Alphaproteobacteria bacterium HGW-Alphaproteobacteria-12]|nr:MAG: hypothetical protein CVT73_00015 [Alphaproteobacteria bacterium HGW-Alphaproteobacteria-12]